MHMSVPTRMIAAAPQSEEVIFSPRMYGPMIIVRTMFTPANGVIIDCDASVNENERHENTIDASAVEFVEQKTTSMNANCK